MGSIPCEKIFIKKLRRWHALMRNGKGIAINLNPIDCQLITALQTR
ncbi:protein of unknown function [Pseudodesulfovibrio piezophilus C1TLV30]|uniref:Uncharacterized protein n=1 Tax=Pseudodesulfovibrio piezophilus (strain DSM 21447 / JCM 15486 / C1TLV30) TaxID=1322246 RepID=M1WK07_PSEP2|nr:protein of unknown function [Pseudodesulfovibrio piezophilus C1TLV30]